ncbi:FMN-binding negative transcriptional regulator [Paraglaciecola aestuariivivens]
MFTATPYKMTDSQQQLKFIQQFGFGIVFSSGQSLIATHVPFVLKANEGKQGVLFSHLAKANPQTKELDNNQVLVVFSGPHAYISPNWYTQKPAVPTWNYSAVHAYGKAKLLTPEATLASIDDLLAHYEPNLLNQPEVVSPAHKERLLAGIVGIKIEIHNLQGQHKLGQDRKQADQQSIFQQLTQSQHLHDRALAEYMQAENIGMGVK